MMGIATAGTQDAVRTFKTDKQFEDRFDVAPLPRWRLDGSYRSRLSASATLMPLRQASHLDERDIATKLDTSKYLLTLLAGPQLR